MDLLHSAPGDEPVILEAVFHASPGRVFRAWTEPAEIMAWFGPEPGCVLAAEIDLKLGGKWRFSMATEGSRKSFLEGEYLEIESGRKLVFSWTHVVEVAQGKRDVTPKSKVSVIFEPHGKGTRLHLRHEAIIKHDARLGVGKGWKISLQSLVQLLEL